MKGEEQSEARGVVNPGGGGHTVKVLITGAGGMLGQALVRVLSGHDLVPLTREALDVTDGQAVERAIRTAAPKVVVHAAAWTHVDACEADPDRAFRVNAHSTRHVALACRARGAACCYISTDYVFDGTKPDPYLEEDAPNPLSVYGASKLAGEREIQAHLDRFWIVRTSWLYGPGGRHFVGAILARAKAGESLRVVSDQVGAPTLTVDLAEALATLIRTQAYGTYHLTNGGACSWYDFALRILQLSGLGTTPVKTVSSAELHRPARRPANSRLKNARWEALGQRPLRSWEAALEDYLRASSGR